MGAVHLHANIKARIKTYDEAGEEITLLADTTPGRMLLSEIMPRHPMIQFSLINRLLTKKEISQVIDVVYRHCGQKETVIFADQLMQIGFSRACSAGISFGKDDMVVPATKETLVDKTRALVKEFEGQYAEGLITQGEKYNKVIDAWSQCTDQVADEMMREISGADTGQESDSLAPINSIYMMAHSGARGSTAQMKQLAGMRGLMAKPSGEIIETPIISNFKEGLSVLEYFNSTHGARKGLADTALKTANSGYLTRRLVDVAQDVIISEEDCGTAKGLTVRAIIDGGEIIDPLSDRVLGRTTAVDVLDPSDDKVLVSSGTLLEEPEVAQIEAAGVEEMQIRSVLTCESKEGVCVKCYGRDLARGTVVNIGEAVGVIAAQSIGEPGTQLTMRTFHIGGAVQSGAQQSSIETTIEGVVKIVNRTVVIASDKIPVVMSRKCELLLLDEKGRERARYRVPYGSRLLADEGEKVERGRKLAEWDPHTRPIITEKGGRIQFADLEEGVSVREVIDEATGIASKVVVDWKPSGKGDDLRPRLVIVDKRDRPLKLSKGQIAQYELPVDAIIGVENGDEVHAGDAVARIPQEFSRARDITGGLPRVAELFEARKPKEHAIISECDGYIQYGKDYKSKRRLMVVPEDEETSAAEYLIPKGKHITVQEGDYVQKGDLLMDGNPVPHDILRVLGVAQLADYLINEIQEVYRLQGVKINDKHIEVICRQMLQKVEIVDAGDTIFLVGEQVDRTEFDAENVRIIANGGKPAEFLPVLQGITKASLQTSSFISAASFQETTRVLTEAAVNGRSDGLRGLKENVIVGRLIPAGTGRQVNNVKQVAAERDREILEARAEAADAAQRALSESEVVA